MDAATKRRAEEIFLAIVEHPPHDRRTRLAAECGEDSRLRAEVDELLSAFERSEGYFERLPQRLGLAHLLSSSSDPQSPLPQPRGSAGESYGNYMLTSLLGSGGSGCVWRARRSDGAFDGDVAIKLLSSSTGLARFHLEGSYLAKLAHPNIARLLDAGVDASERPYLVLEYVAGTPIDDYCNASGLTVEGRIDLFLQVLDAVAHAHARLIVHRDIKPANVQVTADGVVKLLDFGIAKLLVDDAPAAGDLTRRMGLVLTPQYAAPEQLDGGAVTTSVDIYSLGLLLWRLLAGATPRQQSTATSLDKLRELARRDPPRLIDTVPTGQAMAELATRCNTSVPNLVRHLRGDLDSIVRKAAAIEPEDRYGTVADFAQDLRRYLLHEPVEAQPQTVPYRVRKFVRRHRGGVLTAIAVVVAIVGATVAALWQGVEARRQRNAALYQQQRATATSNFMSLLLSEIGSDGRPLTLGDLLDRGSDMLEKQYGTDQRFLAPLWYEVASQYFVLGRVDKLTAALKRAEQAARAHNDNDVLAAALCTLGRVALRTEPDRAKAWIEEGRKLHAALPTPSSESRLSCARGEALVLELAGDRAAAIQALNDTLIALEADPSATVLARTQLMTELSRLYFNARQLDRTLDLNQRTRRLMEGAGLDGTTGYLLVTMNGASILQTLGEIRAAYELQSGLVDRVMALEADGRLVGLSVQYSSTLLRLARYDEALPILQRQVANARSSSNALALAQARLQLGRALALVGRFAEADEHLDAAEAELRKSPTTSDRLLEGLSAVRTQAHLDRGEIERARELNDAALARLGYPQKQDSPGLLQALERAASIALASGDNASAARLADDFHRSAVRMARAPERSADVGKALALRGRARLASGDARRAASDLTDALTALTNGVGADHPDSRLVQGLLASQ